jgi:hypothetical protein
MLILWLSPNNAKLSRGTAFMYRTHQAGIVQQKRLRYHATNNDSNSFLSKGGVAIIYSP